MRRPRPGGHEGIALVVLLAVSVFIVEIRMLNTSVLDFEHFVMSINDSVSIMLIDI